MRPTLHLAWLLCTFPTVTSACPPKWTSINMAVHIVTSDYSFQNLPRDVQNRITKSFERVSNFYNSLICVRDPAHFPSIPQKSLHKCKGVVIDFATEYAANMFVAVVKVDKCKSTSTLATARECVSSGTIGTPGDEAHPESNRPLIGAVTVCEGHEPGKDVDVYKFGETIKHELLHSLFFNQNLFSKTKPPIAQQTKSIKWSHSKNGREVVEHFDFRFVTSPTVMEFVAKTFKCDAKSNPGAALEEYGGSATAQAHWDYYWFGRDIMAGQAVERSYLTELTASLMLDTNWYKLGDRTLISKWPYPKTLNCDYLTKSCYDAIHKRMNQLHPVCKAQDVVAKPSLDSRNKYKCNLDGSAVMRCPYRVGEMSEEDKRKLQQELTDSQWKFDKVKQGMVYEPGYFSTDPWTMFCPIWRVSHSSKGEQEDPFARTCFLNQSGLREVNLNAESFGRASRCFDTSASKFESFRKKRCTNSLFGSLTGGAQFDVGAGAACYRFRCHFGRLQLKPAGEEINKDRWLTCYAKGNKLKVSRQLTYQTEDGTYSKGIYQGVIFCPSCEAVCNERNGVRKSFRCGKEVPEMESRDIQQLCGGEDRNGVASVLTLILASVIACCFE